MRRIQNVLSSMLVSMLLSMLGVGCLDYSFFPEKDKNLPEDTGNSPTDADGNAINDPSTCSDDWNFSLELNQTEVCYQEQTTGILDFVVEWEKTEYEDYTEWSQCVMAPVIGQLTDDNNDGLINSADDPDIVIITDDAGTFPDRHGVIRLLRGADGGMIDAIEMATLDNYTVHPYRYSNVALGDVDVDGTPEIVFLAEVIENMVPVEDTGLQDTAEPIPEPADDGGDSGGGGGQEPGDNPISPKPPGYKGGSGSGGQGGGQGGGGQGGGPGGPGGGTQPPVNVTCRVVAMNPRMEIEWVGPVIEEGCGGHAPFLTDLTGDGTVEVLVGSVLAAGANGAEIARGQSDKGRYVAYVEIGLHSIAVDLDGDRTQEILVGRSVYDHNMVQLCKNDASQDGFTAAADFDLDGKGEVLLVGNGEVTIFEKDCSTIARWHLPGFGTGGPPTVADYDGDAEPEIGIVDGEFYTVFEADGTILWSQAVSDISSHATGSIVFDFEDDAIPEVVYADEKRLWVLDGKTGRSRISFMEHTSRTLHEYPTIADLDKDGSAEIIIMHGGGSGEAISTGMTVLGSASSNWPRGRQLWNQHAYFITNINDDLTIPSRPLANWTLYNNFRSGGMSQQIGTSLPDGVIDIDYCLDECADGKIYVGVALGNQGLGPLVANTRIDLYTDGNRLLDSKELGTRVAPMETSDVVEFILDATDIRNGIIRAEMVTNDCGDGNNSVQISSVVCED